MKEYRGRAASIVQKMTLKEKSSLCSGLDEWSTQPVRRLNVPGIWLSDGPHGLRRAPETHLPGYGDQLPATCYPTASALAASWDLELVENYGRVLGAESNEQSIGVLLGPGVNIKRSALAGRNFEFFSEDPLLSGNIGAAYIEGVQSQGVGTSLKHYAANNVETKRMWNNSDVDMRTFHEIYLKPFEIAVKKAQPWTIMACYNRVMGEYGSQNEYILKKVLNEWGFEGIVISDWISVIDRVKALGAGLNIEMPNKGSFNDKTIEEAVENGTLDEEVVTKNAEAVVAFALMATDKGRKKLKVDYAAHHVKAREIAAECITLLKNDDRLLPFDSERFTTIAVLGEFAQCPRYQGNGSSEVKPTQLDTIWDVLSQEYGTQYSFTYAQGYSLENDDELGLIDEAVAAARNADAVIICAGLPLSYESEGIDRTHLDMPVSQNRLIEKVCEVQKNVTVVLTNGSAVCMPWIERVTAVLECWLIGQAGAGAIVDAVFGNANPSGKLAETFPLRLEDTPAFFNFPGEFGEVLYGERFYVGYRYYDARKLDVLFPFGHGLSYTSFDYQELSVDRLTVNVRVRNSGECFGKEVVQLYLGASNSKVSRSVRELKAFRKIALNAGESAIVSFTLTKDDFSYFDPLKMLWIAESGIYNVYIGSSSRDIRLETELEFISSQKVPLMFNEYTFLREFWENDQTKGYIMEMMPKWLSGWKKDNEDISKVEIQDFFLDHPIVKFAYIDSSEITYDDIDALLSKCEGLTYDA
ncbi:MAG: glycoside hydrolase family 3 C-terminal domain-containing protein [Spirochaetes bacterium]|jgi:beta-glucosidase|nr:glycoside hydrolase family 3 C-terminal domain-containing protein [Spirochaetota bacterium]